MSRTKKRTKKTRLNQTRLNQTRLDSSNFRIFGRDEPQYEDLLHTFRNKGVEPITKFYYFVAVAISNIKAVALAQIFLGTDNKIRNDFTWLLNSKSDFQRQIKPLEKQLSKEILLRAKKDIESADW
ncbi:MAG: hypothetical protein ABFS56_08780 [Pseudomonadota bacterium]